MRNHHRPGTLPMSFWGDPTPPRTHQQRVDEVRQRQVEQWDAMAWNKDIAHHFVYYACTLLKRLPIEEVIDLGGDPSS